MRCDARIRAVCGEGTVYLHEGLSVGVYSGASAAVFSAVLMMFLSCFLIVSGGQTVVQNPHTAAEWRVCGL